MRWPRLLSLVGSLAILSATSAQVPPDKVLPTFKVSDGLELSLWASEPLFVNPTCMDVDHLSRVWVCEAVNYRAKANPPLRPEGDRIVILEDTKGAGKADKATVFYQGKDLQAPLGIAVAKDPVGSGYKVYVCQSPDLLLFEDKDGKGKADGPPRKLLTNFGGTNHDHGIHGILLGPDGKLYFSVGDTGVHGLQGADKKGPTWKSNSTDCRAGTVWRCNLDGTGLEMIAHNFRNEYEPCVDSFGTVFVSDNDDDGNQQTRICYVMPGGNYGYHPRGPGQTHWHEEQPGVVTKILRTGFGSPTGICVYEGTLLPKKYQGQLLHTDAGPRHVRCYHLTPNGASYDVEREDMVQSTDNWFRPSDVCVAPDGSVYVADWYDPGVGGHGMGDWTRGRIFRIAPKSNKPGVPKVDLEGKEGLTAALASPALSVRYMAIAKLLSMDQKAAVELLEAAAVQKDNDWLRARSLWLLGKLGRMRLVTTAFHDPDPRFRILAMRVLKDYQNQSPADYMDDWKQKLINDSDAAVRREALLLLRNAEPARAKPLILALAKKYDGKDRFYLNAIGIAAGHFDKARRDVILADFDQQFPQWNEQVANLVWELRPTQVLPRLEKQLLDAKLPAAQRGQIVDILAAAEGIEAGKTLLKVLQSDVPPDVRNHIVENLKQFLPGKWSALRPTPELASAITRLLGQAESKPTALALIGAADKNDTLAKVTAIIKDAKESGPIRTSAIQTLGVLTSVEAITALEAVLAGEALPLRTEAVNALGKQAQQNAKRPATGAAVKALQKLVTEAKQDASLRQAAVTALSGSRPGTIWLLELNDKKQLPENLKPEVARLLRNSPYQDLRNKAMIAFPPPGRIDPKKLPAIPALVARKGKADHGKLLLAATAKNDLQCLKCHTIRGQGGQIGPDLSVIGKKAGRDNLFESILMPSKAIADQYVTWIIETKKGVVVSGLIIEETATHITLRDANGKDTKVDKKEVDVRAKDPKSIMPDNLLVYMTEDDLVDIVEYLATLKTPVLSMDYWHIIGPFDNGADDAGLDQVFPPEKTIDLKAVYAGKGDKVNWQLVKPNAQGYVDLKAFFAGKSDQIVSYVYRAIGSPDDQDATVLLGTDDGAKLWVNGTLVHTNKTHGAAVPEKHAVAVRLKKGVNTILLKVNNGNGDHGFYFNLVSDQELKRLDEK